MPPRQLALFPEILPRRARNVMMHVIDVGDYGCVMDGPTAHVVRYGCKRCGRQTGWIEVPNATTAKRGIPCAVCNKK